VWILACVCLLFLKAISSGFWRVNDDGTIQKSFATVAMSDVILLLYFLIDTIAFAASVSYAVNSTVARGLIVWTALTGSLMALLWLASTLSQLALSEGRAG
jgi:hypothetical protein